MELKLMNLKKTKKEETKYEKVIKIMKHIYRAKFEKIYGAKWNEFAKKQSLYYYVKNNIDKIGDDETIEKIIQFGHI